MRTQIHQSIAEKLETAIHTDTRFVVPSINRLAETYGVSYQTMWKAVQILVKKGIVTTRRGRTMQICGASAAASQPDAVTRLCDHLRCGVQDGAYQAGQRFPKAEFFVSTQHASPLTVSRALARLASEGLSHKQRNQWIAGPAPATQPVGSQRRFHDDAPVVLVACDSSAGLAFGYMNPFMHRFMSAFVDGCLHHGIRLSQALIHATSGETPGVPSGLSETQAAIRGLGARYRGMLILSTFPDTSDVGLWTASTYALGRPVAFFDSADKGAFLNRSALSVGKRYFRFHFDDKGAVDVALKALLRAGHTRIGMHATELFDWGKRRTSQVVARSSESGRDMTVHLSGAAEPMWDLYRDPQTAQPTPSIVQRAIPGFRRTADAMGLARALANATPSLATMLVQHQPTALLALNDEMARDYYFWLHGAGIRVPQDLSILSFDNLPVNLTVSTIDFGFSRLGYLASRVFVGDIPIRADRTGNVPGVCTFVDRGTVSEPRKRRLSIAGAG